MKVIKPLKLGVLTRCFEFNGKFHMGVSILAFMPLAEKKPSLLSETSMWKFTSEQLGQESVLEAGIPKARPEFLVTGKAFTPNKDPKQGLPVKVKLGKQEKELLVFGDRFWDGDSPSGIKPFTEMQIDWQHAFGGDEFGQNPLGKGYSQIEENGVKVKWIPNIQSRQQQITSFDSKPEPVSFGPIDVLWPQRMSLQGTYDEEWTKKYYPGFPPDIDWGYFNLASQDQQFTEKLNGDEQYSIENMNVQQPLIEGFLPNIKACCFVTQKIEKDEVFEEIKTNLRTVWFFPNDNRAVLVFQGSIEVMEEDAADILHLIASAENRGEPRSLDHYQKVLKKRLDKKKGGLYALQDSDLLPENLNTQDPDVELAEKQLEPSGHRENNLRRKTEVEHKAIRKKLLESNLDVEKYGPKPFPKKEKRPTLEELPKFLEEKQKAADEQKKKLDKLKPKQEKELKALCEEQGLDYKEVQEKIKKSGWEPPKLVAEVQLEQYQQKKQELELEDVSSEEIKQKIGERKPYEDYVQKEREVVDLYRLSAHLRDKPPRLTDEQSKQMRQQLAEQIKEGRGVREQNYLGLDLSGRNLNGLDLQGIYLAGANLDGADLRGANLSDAVLAHASMKGVYLEGANLNRANLGKTELQQAKFQSCLLTNELILAGANLEGADLSNTRLEGVDCFESIFLRANLNSVVANSMTFLEADLRGCSFERAKLNGCNFIKVDVSNASFSNSELSSATFLKSKGVGTNFWKAQMNNLRFIDKCDFSSSNFSFGVMNEVNFRGSILKWCNFQSVNMTGADFSECKLEGSLLDRSIAIGSMFTKTDLTDASMIVMNLMSAVLTWSNLSGADLSQANLYQADLARVYLDSETILNGANLGKARIIPKHLKLKNHNFFEI
ncbi:DUF2169 domain-containing protein [Cocleimonas sp. KMM 6892]|uniref:DUF2169 family type VI secretion system accessory protein n=1 Tax=unclassified Cocleimonas TaxID=2639732 RepID=UPI002DBA492B|nr:MULTISPECIES: DUF2169 domain-containing protein [unclassified Cocleimonas]MEB8434453.1 DUF2169 domain-containing protein [Cocleimonas sp. KMM 6892]MEC4717346.1 DUF2169 domain-containing protein [Cocleimonas sp. KMM 6895]MEC4746725.1 DUF2169 domain-containing protein [Cocleimonas sp. KMM 6896]